MAKNNKQEKAIVTQDNRFIFAKYNMKANELKFFMWIVAQINSQQDQLFQICEIPVKEIFNVLNQKKSENYTYIRNLCESMLQKTYIEDFKLLDEKTMKSVRVFQGYTLFDYIRYKEGEATIHYKLNDFLMEYLLNLKGNFTQLKFTDIQKMKSSYSIRIYNMLLSELKQNRQSFKISLVVLHNILETPKSVQEKWSNFKKIVLDQAMKDINSKSNIVLFNIDPIKEGRKITSICFSFDYRGNEDRITRDKIKTKNFLNYIASDLDALIGKRIYFGKKLEKRVKNLATMEDLIIYSYTRKEDTIHLMLESQITKKIYHLLNIKTSESLTLIKKAVERGANKVKVEKLALKM